MKIPHALLFTSLILAILPACGDGGAATKPPSTAPAQFAERPPLSPEQKAAAEKMAAQAELALKGLLELEEIRPRTPEFIELKLAASRRVLTAKLLLNTEKESRKQALQEYLARARLADAQIQLRKDVDATRASLAAAAYSVAEAEYLLASEQVPPTTPPAQTAEQKSALENSLKFARDEYRGLREIDEIRPRTPEHLELQFASSRRIVHTELALHTTQRERKQAIADHQERLDTIKKSHFPGDLDGRPRASYALMYYALAEAEFLLASEK